MSHNKNVTGHANVSKRGSGLGTGPVGTTNGRRSSGGSSAGSNVKRAGAGGIAIIAVILSLIFGKGMLGGSGNTNNTGAGNNGGWQ